MKRNDTLIETARLFLGKRRRTTLVTCVKYFRTARLCTPTRALSVIKKFRIGLTGSLIDIETTGLACMPSFPKKQEK